MAAIQPKDLVMVKIAQPVHPIVTVQAQRAELGLVFIHEHRILLGVTVGAGLQIGAADLQASLLARLLARSRRVAGRAIHHLPSVIQRMAGQAEAGGRGMLERLAIQAGGRPAGARMAASTLQAQQAQVHGRLGMAVLANLRNVLNLAVQVAVGAAHGSVQPI